MARLETQSRTQVETMIEVTHGLIWAITTERGTHVERLLKIVPKGPNKEQFTFVLVQDEIRPFAELILTLEDEDEAS